MFAAASESGLHLEALYPALAAVIVGVLAFVKRTGKTDTPDPDINVETLVKALGASEARLQDEQDQRQRAESAYAAEHALRERAEAELLRERRRRNR